jgi:hypothetical protein
MNTAQYSKGAMNAPLCWQLRDDAYSDETRVNTPRFPIPTHSISLCVGCILYSIHNMYTYFVTDSLPMQVEGEGRWVICLIQNVSFVLLLTWRFEFHSLVGNSFLNCQQLF